jgi:hypothetical protein
LIKSEQASILPLFCADSTISYQAGLSETFGGRHRIKERDKNRRRKMKM